MTRPKAVTRACRSTSCYFLEWLQILDSVWLQHSMKVKMGIHSIHRLVPIPVVAAAWFRHVPGNHESEDDHHVPQIPTTRSHFFD
jgi:hypothetical protein